MLAPNFYPAYGAECLVNSKLALAFLNKGWDVNVISHINKEYNFFDSSEGAVWNQLRDVSVPIKSVESKSVGATLTKLSLFLRTGHITNGMLWVQKCIDSAKDMIERKGYDVLISRAIPEYSHLPAMYLSKKYRIPWIANWNDPVPNSKFLPPTGLGPGAPLKAHTLRFLKKILREADWHTFPGERLRNYISGYIGESVEHKSTIIPHISLDIFSSSNRIKQKRFILCHTGGPRNPRHLLKPLSELILDKTVGDDVEAYFCGSIENEINDLAKNLGIGSKVNAKGWISYEASLKKLKSSTVSLIIEDDYPEGIYLPSKMADYLQVKNPILALGPKTGSVKDYIEKFGGGIYIHCTDEDAIGRAIESLYISWKTDRLHEQFNTDKLREEFSEQRTLSLYEAIFSNVLRS